MHFETRFSSFALALALLSLTNRVRADNPPCVENCFVKNPTLSTCSPGMPAQSYNQCVCDSFSGPQDPLISCVKSSCSADDQTVYAYNLPSTCRQDFFPKLDLSGPPPSSDDSDDDSSPSSGGDDDSGDSGDSGSPSNSGGDNDDKDDAASAISVSLWGLALCGVVGFFNL